MFDLNINVTLGGNLTNESYQFIKNLDWNHLLVLNLENALLRNQKILIMKFTSLVNNGVEFELFWLNFKKQMYQKRSEEEINRIHDLTKRIRH